jgi:AraC-like DNA-binding protein/beta-galactosidase beta subunit
MESKNNAESTLIEKGVYLLRFSNDTLENQEFKQQIDKSYIQFHFCLKGESVLNYKGGGYQMPVSEDKSVLLYNTQQDLPLHLILNPNSWMISVVMSLTKFHELFSSEAHQIHFLRSENKKYYAQEPITPSIAVLLSQLFQYKSESRLNHLYAKAKVYELMALYFGRTEDSSIGECPFLADEENVKKIRLAKEIIISRMSEPPTLEELSKEIDLSLKKLKNGFKQIYGDTVFGFLFDYKMEYARKLLGDGEGNVNEIGLKIGYSTASHFIAAFKKKYGTTPKKYLQSTQTGVQY